jgi:hypothetical protein
VNRRGVAVIEVSIALEVECGGTADIKPHRHAGSIHGLKDGRRFGEAPYMWRPFRFHVVRHLGEALDKVRKADYAAHSFMKYHHNDSPRP